MPPLFIAVLVGKTQMGIVETVLSQVLTGSRQNQHLCATGIQGQRRPQRQIERADHGFGLQGLRLGAGTPCLCRRTQQQATTDG